MNSNVTRREFLGTVAAAGVWATTGGWAHAGWKTQLKKALIGKPDQKTLTAFKEAGFDGLETRNWNAEPEEAEKARRLAESLGMKIHSVMRGWTNFNSDKPEVVERDVESVRRALRAAHGYGADAVLLVPCRIRGMKIPEAWEFDIEFDPKTGHVKRVVRGDNSPYEDYIKAHNYAVDASRAAVEKLIPVAEKLQVIIALENVWNNLWVKPDLFQNFVASFGSPWVQAYFDIGNHVKYAPPEQWIRTLGKLIKKCHVKDFKLNPDGHGGKFVNIREGSVNWPEVRRALDEVGYNGWLTIEGSGGLSLEERSRRLDLIIAGR